LPYIVFIALAAVAVLMFKHAVADFYLQSTYEYMNKGTTAILAAFQSAIPVALRPLVYLVIAPTLLLSLGAASEFLLNYPIDCLKEQIAHRNGWTAQDRCFWFALGTDQLVRGLTYLVIVAVLIAWVAR
jgi:hypothetical protein